MTDGRPQKKAVSWSVIVGTLLIPLSAVGAVLIAQPGASSEADPTTVPVAVEPTSPSTVSTTGSGAGSNPDDIRTACGTSGMELVALEERGETTEIQQAALDALRDVCEQEGLPLPPAPTPQPIIETVTVEPRPVPGEQDDRSVGSDWEDEDREDDDRSVGSEWEDEDREDNDWEDDDWEDDD